MTGQITIPEQKRIRSIDVIRGAIMVLMAIDHVRVYSGVPAGSPDPPVFFTRWITHFCAPGFAFLAGTAIYFQSKKLHDLNKLSAFLLTRGLLLVLLEITLIRFFWTFNLDFDKFFLAGVIWMLGWCMVLMALFVRLKPAVAGIIGICIIVFQELFSYLPKMLPQSAQSSFGKFWEFFYPSGSEGPDGVAILYVLIPWIGVMAAGYGFGLIMNQVNRRKICLTLGLTMILLFALIGITRILYNPAEKSELPFIMQLLNQRKYPASPLYLLMTLGPLIAFIPLAEKARGWFSDVLAVFGKVPMFYYLLHILIIHLTALLVNTLLTGSGHQEWYSTAPYASVEEKYRWSLPLLYLVFIIDVAILYFACKWYAKYKFSRNKGWTNFI